MKPKINDIWIRIVAIPVVALVTNLFFFYKENVANNIPFIKGYLHALVMVLLLWEANRQVLLYVRRLFPSLDQTAKRIIFSIIGYLVATAVIVSLFSWYYDFTKYWGDGVSAYEFSFVLFVSFTYVFLIGAIYESVYYFGEWKRTTLETAELKEQQLQMQLSSLKEQINPHFLFNSLNSLSSLISENPKQAEEFADEMAVVYRYVLQVQDTTLTTLQKELDFIKAYHRLLHTRYGNRMHLTMDVQQDDLTWLLPPLTLQLLVENAVKHNAFTAEEPLYITISSAPETNAILVSNNIKPRPSAMSSHKVGLQNIQTKYRLLKAGEIKIVNDNQYFVVQIPLIGQ